MTEGPRQRILQLGGPSLLGGGNRRQLCPFRRQGSNFDAFVAKSVLFMQTVTRQGQAARPPIISVAARTAGLQIGSVMQLFLA